ncbi:unnamed protein product [Allacma fusca]|uniref:Uncharacterized protein n=1 Tax=Allacma fusca TaxID=39272 RepID=A0A8J2J4Q9_9HEXA|nr:unnamed protein product [Allacma fusca]
MFTRKFFRRLLTSTLVILTLNLFRPLVQLHWIKVQNDVRNSNLNNLEQLCKIPKLSPQILLQNNILPAPKCYNSTALLFRIDSNFNLIRSAPDLIHWNSSVWNSSKCFYKHLFRIPNKPDFNYLEGTPVIEIKNETTPLPSNIDHLRVWCNYITSQEMFYEDYLSAVQLKPEVEDELIPKNGGAEKYSLMILGQDSMSRMNFIRTMPKVQDFLLNTLGAVEFQGLNAIGSTTLWNIFPLISGLSKEHFQSVCNGAAAYLQSCPFVWKLFEEQGYRTAFTEDYSNSAGTILPVVDGRHAFLRQPFHYDFRSVNRKHRLISSEEFCFVSRLSISVLLEHMIGVATRLHDKPYWAFMWAQSLSHFDNTLSTYAETSMLSSLKYLHRNQLLNNTILILLSDHGSWWRDFKNSQEQAFMEQRLPLLYIVLPKKFQDKYSLATKNLRENSHRLVTLFDVHETMKDLLNLKGLSNMNLRVRQKEEFYSTSRNLSLFLPVNPNRTCAMAGISLINCACVPRYSTSVSDPGVVSAASSVLKKINGKIRNYPQCSKLSLVNITNVYVTAARKPLDSDEYGLRDLFKINGYNRDVLTKTRGEYFELIIETTPGAGMFYASVGVDGRQGGTRIEDIVRVSLYGHDADCMPAMDLKPGNTYADMQNNYGQIIGNNNSIGSNNIQINNQRSANCSDVPEPTSSSNTAQEIDPFPDIYKPATPKGILLATKLSNIVKFIDRKNHVKGNPLKEAYRSNIANLYEYTNLPDNLVTLLRDMGIIDEGSARKIIRAKETEREYCCMQIYDHLFNRGNVNYLLYFWENTNNAGLIERSITWLDLKYSGV